MHVFILSEIRFPNLFMPGLVDPIRQLLHGLRNSPMRHHCDWIEAKGLKRGAFPIDPQMLLKESAVEISDFTIP